MTDEEIESIFSVIRNNYEIYIKKYGVKEVSLKKNGKYTKNALVLVYLARGYPNTSEVSKSDLTVFIRQYYPETTDVQQARHLAKQAGYFIISGTRGDIGDKVATDSYKLKSLSLPYPGFCSDRRSGIAANSFEELKYQYGFRCATCGSKEGEPHNFRKNELTILQAGHMDPSQPLSETNTIPQCQVCNRPDRDRWIYDRTGRTIGIADTAEGRRVVKNYLKRISRAGKEYFRRFISKLLGQDK